MSSERKLGRDAGLEEAATWVKAQNYSGSDWMAEQILKLKDKP
jgi:hypothetical protein